MDTKHFKDLLLKELNTLEGELETLGRKNPDHLSDWETIRKTPDGDTADEADLADSIEEFENNNAVLAQLEIRLNNIKAALVRIDNGSYGKCEIGGEDIELDRLEANPAASTCKAHMNS